MNHISRISVLLFIAVLNQGILSLNAQDFSGFGFKVNEHGIEGPGGIKAGLDEHGNPIASVPGASIGASAAMSLNYALSIYIAVAFLLIKQFI